MRLAPWLLAASMVAACAHGGSTSLRGSVDDDALRAALAHPTQRDRPLLERRLLEVESFLARASDASIRLAELRTRLALLHALAGLADERTQAFAAAASTEVDSARADVASHREAEARARGERAALERRVAETLDTLLGAQLPSGEAGVHLAERLSIAVEAADGQAPEFAARLLERHPTSPGRSLALIVLARAAASEGRPADALRHLSALVRTTRDGAADAEHRTAALVAWPEAYVRSRPPGTLSGAAALAHLRALDLDESSIDTMLDAIVLVALRERRVTEALDVARGEAERAGDGPLGCRAQARVVAARSLGEPPPRVVEELTDALARYAELRERERGSDAERACRVALVGPALSIATRLYQDALGLPDDAGLGERVPAAIRPFDRGRMRLVDALLTAIAAAFPDLRADDTHEADLPHRDVAAIDAARRVVADAILATDPTPPPPPRRHPPRRRHHGRRSHRSHGGRPESRAHR